MADTTNQRVASNLRELADLLEQQGANPFRVAAYRRAADTVAANPEDLETLVKREGFDGLTALPGVGRSIAAAIQEMLRTGRWSQLERLRGTLEPERLLQTVPGVGPALARRLHDHLDADTLEALEIAAHDGRLEAVPGFGPRRASMPRAALASMLGRRLRRTAAPLAPGVDMLLDIDREYREQAKLGKLRTIAPRWFNPSGESWLPILHARRGTWDFTALFSNTARAHELGKVKDWVVIYFHTDDQAEGQCTVVTETRGPLAGERVVRGREAECRDLYTAHGSSRSKLVSR